MASINDVSEKVKANFWKRVVKTEGCWEWIGASSSPGGYGCVCVHIRTQHPQKLDAREQHTIGAHRFSWQLAYGLIPEGLLVLHKCDNRKCVRPDHLFLGTHKDNMADMTAKNRQATGDNQGLRLHPESRCRGERNASAKLTDEQVREIKTAWKPETRGLAQALARRFGVHVSIVRRIGTGKLWRHIP